MRGCQVCKMTWKRACIGGVELGEAGKGEKEFGFVSVFGGKIASTTLLFRKEIIDKVLVLQVQHQTSNRCGIPLVKSVEDSANLQEILQEKSRTIGLSLDVNVRRRGARVSTSFSFPVHVHTVLKLHYWTITLVVSQTSTLITGESSLIPSSKVEISICLLVDWSSSVCSRHLMPFVLLARASIVVTFSLPLVASILCYLVFFSFGLAY
ncbi:hypothetical protein Tco_1193499 [Tanacetum coccineum]